MNILAIETTGVTGSIAYLPQNIGSDCGSDCGSNCGSVCGSDRGCVHPLCRTLPTEERSAESLLPSLEALLAEGRIDLDDIDRIAVAVGPGSFTGLRIGVTCANILAWGLSRNREKQVELVAVDTLHAMALSAAQERAADGIPDDFIISVGLDAQRREVTAREFLVSSGTVSPLESSFRLIGIDRWLSAPEERELPGDQTGCQADTGIRQADIGKRIVPLFFLGKMPPHRPEIQRRFLPLPTVCLAATVAKIGRTLAPGTTALRPVYSRLSAAEEKLALKKAAAANN